jgi:hypothetical protein
VGGGLGIVYAARRRARGGGPCRPSPPHARVVNVAQQRDDVKELQRRKRDGKIGSQLVVEFGHDGQADGDPHEQLHQRVARGDKVGALDDVHAQQRRTQRVKVAGHVQRRHGRARAVHRRRRKLGVRG